MIKSVVISTQPARGDDPGACEIGHYKVENGFVVMCDENGRAPGKKCQLIGEDAHRVAGRLLHEAWLKRASESDYNSDRIRRQRLALAHLSAFAGDL
jgi:hypothetical protein